MAGNEPLIRSSSSTTHVEFGQLTDKEIQAYIATGNTTSVISLSMELAAHNIR